MRGEQKSLLRKNLIINIWIQISDKQIRANAFRSDTNDTTILFDRLTLIGLPKRGIKFMILAAYSASCSERNSQNA